MKKKEKNENRNLLQVKVVSTKSLLAVELQLYYVLSEPVDISFYLFQWKLSLYLNVH